MPDSLLLDTMCGKLATYLRMCGYDAAYALDAGEGESLESDRAPSDDDLLARAETEDRRIVTRDRQLADRAGDAVLLKSRDVTGQLRELADAGFDLALPDEPSRCGNCNGRVEAVDPTEPTPEYAPDSAETDVWCCVDCGQHFWKGSHWDDVAETLVGL
ncbi:Mut7-C RNAse domain-containing protein [Halobacteria archaeon HArc-gm2]|nr:Mut7-C RNAse domain-containing protein [Halobacteria archaeon HArc-gm2]